MKYILSILICCLSLTAAAAAQTRKSPGKRPPKRPAAKEPAQKPAAPILGTTVTVITKSGDRITGQLLELTAFSVRVKTETLESTLALNTLTSLTFGGRAMPAVDAPRPIAPRPEFAAAAAGVFAAFQSLLASLSADLDYNEFGRRLGELRRASERLLQKYQNTPNAAEARILAQLAAALTDYTWARTIWTLKLGRSDNTLVGEGDSPAVADALQSYPELRQSAASGSRYSADKLISGLLKKAVDKADQARGLLSSKP